MIQIIQLLRNIGTFDSVTEGGQLPLNQVALIYAENGRGKTTLAAILRSFGSGDALSLLERRRLGGEHAPHIVLGGPDGQTAVFQNGAWANRFADILVFDDHFVAANICSGMEVETAHRQNLHELIIGARGVALSPTSPTQRQNGDRSLIFGSWPRKVGTTGLWAGRVVQRNFRPRAEVQVARVASGQVDAGAVRGHGSGGYGAAGQDAGRR